MVEYPKGKHMTPKLTAAPMATADLTIWVKVHRERFRTHTAIRDLIAINTHSNRARKLLIRTRLEHNRRIS